MMRCWLLWTCALVAAAQAAAQIPERFENLQFFPKDIERAALLEAMRDFSFALGVRCEFCHVGEGGPALANMDFASDDKAEKRTARRMLVMVEAIRKDHIEPLGSARPVRVGCFTCHHGVSRPEAIEDILEEALETSGLEAAIARYRSLRQEHYGSAAYDFGEAPLNRLAEKLLRAGNRESALAVLELNAESHPGSPWLQRLLKQAREPKP